MKFDTSFRVLNSYDKIKIAGGGVRPAAGFFEYIKRIVDGYKYLNYTIDIILFEIAYRHRTSNLRR